MECTCHGTQTDDFLQECPCVLAMASVPTQKWGEIYDSETALKRGTIFKELDLPFYTGCENGGGDSYAG